VDFIPHEKKNCIAVASTTVFRQDILPNSARNFPAKNKYSAPRDTRQRYEQAKLFALELTSSRHVPIEKRSTSVLLYPLKRHSRWCKVSHARRETLRNTARWWYYHLLNTVSEITRNVLGHVGRERLMAIIIYIYKSIYEMMLQWYFYKW